MKKLEFIKRDKKQHIINSENFRRYKIETLLEYLTECALKGFQYLEIEYEYDYHDGIVEEIEITAYNFALETDEEFKKRVDEYNQKQELKKLQDTKAQEKRERTLLAKLKKKYE